MKNKLPLFFFVLLLIPFTGCEECPKHRIAIVQRLDTDIENALYMNYKRACRYFEGCDFSFHTDFLDDNGMIEEIERQLSLGVDAVIINPVGGTEILAPCMEKAYNMGIHVVVVGRNSSTDSVAFKAVSSTVCALDGYSCFQKHGIVGHDSLKRQSVLLLTVLFALFLLFSFLHYYLYPPPPVHVINTLTLVYMRKAKWVRAEWAILLSGMLARNI